MNFIIVNDIRQTMDLQLPYGPWVHHATIKRGFKEYIVFRQKSSGKIYLEEVEQQRATLVLKQIEDQNEWNDLYSFCMNAGLLLVMNDTVKIKR